MSKSEAIPYLILGFIVLILSKFADIFIIQVISVLIIIFILSQMFLKPKTDFESIIYFILSIITFIWAHLSFKLAELIMPDEGSLINLSIGIVIFFIPIKFLKMIFKRRSSRKTGTNPNRRSKR